jgi:hypothetical protein
MSTDTQAPQTLASVIGALIVGLIVFVGGRAVIAFLGAPALTTRAAVGAGLASGLMNVAVAYRRRPPGRRLSPSAAVVVGSMGVVLMIGTLLLALPVDAPWLWRLSVLVIFLPSPVFLLVSGVRERASSARGRVISGGGI